MEGQDMSERDYFVKFAHELGELNGNLTAVLKRIEERMARYDEMMARHEARLSVLEQRKCPKGGASLPKWAVYVMAALAAAVCALAGAKVPSLF